MLLPCSSKRLVVVCGKGGVGKTTMAAAIAVQLARTGAPHKRILLLSIDPAHSLADSLGQPVYDQATSIVIDSSISLQAREIDASRLMEQFKSEHRRELTSLADRGTYFDQRDIHDFLNLSLPGMDEIIAIMELADLVSQNQYDNIVMDTAPTGHTLRMLELPDQMLQWIDLLELMQKKHRYLSETFSGKSYQKDFCDHFLDNLRQRISGIKALLKDPKRTGFVTVAIPEALSLLETRRLIAGLRQKQLPLIDILINRVAPDSKNCKVCRYRHKLQVPILRQFKVLFSDYRQTCVPLSPRSIQGIASLSRLGRFLADDPASFSFSKEYEPKCSQSIAETADWQLSGKLPAFPMEGSFLMIGGKGGVGKTTLSAATALCLARKHPEKRHLIFSTDPAHSLSDVFNLEIGQKPTRITTNLFAVEMNAEQLFDDFKSTFKQDIEVLFQEFTGGKTEIQFDREVMANLVTLAPPGLDEIMAIDNIIDLKSEFEFDRLILDTAPTGHLLRFLAMPQIIREWLRVFFTLLLKYKGVTPLTSVTQKALALSKKIRAIQQTFQDPHRTMFIAVTLAEPMAVAELNDLMEALTNLNITCKAIAVNMITPQSDCEFCCCQHQAQMQTIKKLQDNYPAAEIFTIPLIPHDLRGLDMLNRLVHGC
jgi:arsenite-transporting ATPase